MLDPDPIEPRAEDSIPMTPTQAWAHEFTTGWPVVALFVGTLIIVWMVSPERAGVAMWILCRLALGAFAGNLFASVLIPIGDPQQMWGISRGNAIKSRAICIGAGMIATGWTL